MSKQCAVYGCRGNYKGQPYTRVVRFPTEVVECNRWIKAIPNAGSSLTSRCDLYRVVQKTDIQFYFWDNFGNSAPILTILSLLQAEIHDA